MVKISVIIPVYNVEKYLEKCLDSIINQTFEDIEIICIDDGSSDSSLEILNQYSNNDKRIIVVSQENLGPSQSRNNGIELAQGDYLTFVDADDWIELDCLEKVYNNAILNGSEVVLFNAIEHRTNNQFHKRIYLPIDKNVNYDDFVFDYNYNKQLVMNNMFVVWSKLYKTSFLKKHNIQFPNYIRMFEDIPFHIKTMLFAKYVSYLPEILYNYNKLNENSVQTKNNSRLEIFNIIDIVKQLLNENHSQKEFKLNFLEFALLQSYENLKKSSIELKKEYYEMMRSYFLNLRLNYDVLKNLSFRLHKFYIHVINFEKYETFEKFNQTQNSELNYINKKKILPKINNFDEMGIDKNNESRLLIVSLTSFPERMYDLHYCLYSLLTQSLKPNILVLWLAEEQFPNKENDIPKEVLELKKNGLTIKWCEDIKSYKKLIPALKEYPNDIIVTADDDIFYPKDWLKNMWDAHKKHPNSIISARSRKIQINNNKIDSYLNWKLNYSEQDPSYLNLPTGAGGTLFVPNSLNDNIFDEELFLKLCPSGDDIWFWAMAILNKTKIYAIEKPMHLLCYVNIARELGILDETTLWEINKSGKNDVQFQNVLNQFPEILIELNNY